MPVTNPIQTVGNAGTTTLTLGVTIAASGPVATNGLCATFFYGAGADTIVSVVDNQGNTWTQRDSVTNTSITSYWDCVGAAYVTPGVTLVTITVTAIATTIIGIVQEYSTPGGFTFDRHVATSGNSTAAASGNTSALSSSSELVIGWGSALNAGTITAGTGFGYLNTEVSTDTVMMENLQATSTAAQASAFTLGTSGKWACGVATYSFTTVYTDYEKVTADHTQVPSTQTNFTVLVSTTQTALKTIAHGGKVGVSTGYDILFGSAIGGNDYSWELEFYDGVNGILVAWVQVPSLSSSADTVFYMSFGNTGALVFQGGAKGAAWDTNYKAIWHFKDGTTLSLLDSTSNANNLTNSGATAVAGQIDGAFHVVPNNEASGTFSPLGSAVTNIGFSCWANLADVTATNYIFQAGNSNGYGINVGTSGAGLVSLFRRGAAYDSTGLSMSNTTWTYISMDSASSSWNARVNGSTATAFSTSDPSAPSALINLGQNDFGFNATMSIDELRLSTNRSADWRTIEYNNEKSGSTFITFGPDSQPGGGASIIGSNFGRGILGG